MAKTKKASSPITNNPQTSQPTREEIALRAYEIYLERGGAPGHELEDWTRAEQELSQRTQKPRRKASTKPIAA